MLSTVHDEPFAAEFVSPDEEMQNVDMEDPHYRPQEVSSTLTRKFGQKYPDVTMTEPFTLQGQPVSRSLLYYGGACTGIMLQDGNTVEGCVYTVKRHGFKP